MACDNLPPDGALVRVPGGGLMVAGGLDVPTDGSQGFAPSCTFHHIDGSGANVLYVNTSTSISCSFKKIATEVTVASYLPLAGGTVTGDVVFSSAVDYTPSTVTYAATTDLDLLSNAIQTVTLTGDVTITTSNKAAGRSLLVRLIASGGVRTFTALPAWVWVGGTAPASLASGKRALLSLTCFGTADTDIVAAYAVES